MKGQKWKVLLGTSGAFIVLALLGISVWSAQLLRPQIDVYPESYIVEDYYTSNSWLTGFRHIQVSRVSADCQAVAFYYVRQFEVGRNWTRSDSGCISANNIRPTAVGSEITRMIFYIDNGEVVALINQEYDYSRVREWLSVSTWQQMLRELL